MTTKLRPILRIAGLLVALALYAPNALAVGEDELGEGITQLIWFLFGILCLFNLPALIVAARDDIRDRQNRNR